MKKFWNTFKEELVVIPVFAACIYGYHLFMSAVFPESAQFDMVSEVESIIWALIKLVIFTSASWVALRVVFPDQYRFMIEDYNKKYEGMTNKEKRKQYSITFFAFLIVLALLL